MKDEKEIKQHIKVFVSGDMEGEEKEIDLMLKKVQDESFVEGYKYAMQILEESLIGLKGAKAKKNI